MESPLDTRKLQALCEAVVRDVKGYHEGTIQKAQDEDWARFAGESLPELEAFIVRGQAKPAADPAGVGLVMDPEYSRFITIARLTARENGYALAIHGTMNRDLDLIAVPWVEACAAPEDLVQQIEYRTGCKTNGHPMSTHHHGRLGAVFMIAWSFGDPRYVDFSIIPPRPGGAL